MYLSSSKTDTIQFWVLNVSSFLAQLTIAMVNLALVYHLRRVFALSADRIGLAASISPATYLVFCILLSPYTIHYRPRHLVQLSLLGMAFAVYLFVSTHSLPVAYLALALYGGFMSLLWPQIEGWFSRGKEGASLNRVANAFNFSWSFGVGVSSYIAGLLVEFSTTMPFFVGLAIFGVVYLIISISSALVPGIRAVQSEHTENKTNSKIDQSTPFRFYAWAGIIALYSGMSVILTIFPLYAQDVLGISESQTGLLLLIRGVATCLSFLALGKLEFWHFKKRYIFLVQILFALFCLLATSFTSPIPYAFFFLVFGFLFAFAYDQSMFHGASGSVNRSQRMIIHEVLLTIGTILGAVGGGYVYEHLSFSRLLFVVAICALVLVSVEMAIALFWERRKH
ncbi:MFS transporter [Sphaerochaeta globosa]|uniref:Major facilitator superfamily MFS_1 n=1 Tax=Sphaerochaeta globosa (strain ATCC BAA-1886 / DSM 22777 / Buddy) TaxID=158189 RepID=F0RVM3_SPHGB|nr:MFS transporter [Sphaerochaeta globosa]ADY13015.1 major facilitator superfamily MFS_1 [Sphaerochaeta globosa str. Buddy]